MADAYYVRIDVEKLRQCFIECDGHEWTREEVADWLHECGFRHRAQQTWLCEEIALEALARDEYQIERPA